MAIIHGVSGAEKTLLTLCPRHIKSFYDIKPYFNELKIKLKEADKSFYENLPNIIEKEKEVLKYFQKDLKNTKKLLDKEINSIKNLIKKNKKSFKMYFKLLFNYLDLFLKINVTTPSKINFEINKIKNKELEISDLINSPEEKFKSENKNLISEIIKFENIINSSDYHGAFGELEVLKKIKKLSNSYMVFCDLKIILDDYIFYNMQKNLKSAQFDFVVIGNNGIFVIEVKNWSSSTLMNESVFTPYEQIDRAGKVLYKYLENNFYSFKPKITKILVSIQNNIEYDPNYKTVMVKNLSNLNYFIENSNSLELSESKFKKVTKLLIRKI